MARAIRHCLLALAAIAASPADAQSPPPPAQDPDSSSPEIVVTGTRDRQEQVQDFVSALTPASEGSIPRFIDAVCPVTTGLPPAQNAVVVERLRVVAAGAGIRVAPAGCAPNLFVMVTPKKRPFIELLAKRRPESFGTMSPHEVRTLAQSPGPAAAWQLEGSVDSSGIPVSGLLNRTTEAAGRLTIMGGRGFDGAGLVVEIGALAGLTPIQLADYAAMRLLVKLDPARLPARSPSSILTILTTPRATPTPATLTKWDLGLLRGLYASAINLPASSQRSQIAKRVGEELASGEDEAGMSKSPLS